MKINYLQYIKVKQARGELKSIYKHIKSNFGLIAEPFVLHSIDTNLTAGIWSLLYEIVLVETNVKRNIKEAIAVTVSETNKCKYCVDAHSIMLFNEKDNILSKIQKLKTDNLNPTNLNEELIFWAFNSNKFNDITEKIPFTNNQAPEIIGTIILFNYINRMVEVFAGQSPIPTKLFKKLFQKIAKKFYFSKAILKNKKKGDSLQFLNKQFQNKNELTEIQKALFHFSSLTENNIDGLISQDLIQKIKIESSKLENLNNNLHSSRMSEFLSEIKQDEKQTAEFCYLLMFVSYKIHNAQIERMKKKYNDTEILKIASFSCFIISEKIGAELWSIQQKNNNNTD